MNDAQTSIAAVVLLLIALSGTALIMTALYAVLRSMYQQNQQRVRVGEVWDVWVLNRNDNTRGSNRRTYKVRSIIPQSQIAKGAGRQAFELEEVENPVCVTQK